jgi:hypothetical protein
MAGLYPNDQILSIFGNEVLWPGLDPVTHKFTNGDFTDPLKKPSFIPAETINLIVDNLQTFISGLGLTPNNTDPNQLLNAIQNKYATTDWLKNYFFPVGSPYKQGMNDPTPMERGLPGSWEVWSSRADGYGLILGALPYYTPYTPGTNYALGAYVLNHIAGGDYRLYQAKEAITNAPQYLDPVKWQILQTEIIIARRHLQGWLDADFTIGQLISSGPYANWTVAEVIVPGGKFDSIEGEFRPPFVNGGVAGEERHTLTIDEMPAHTHNLPPNWGTVGNFGWNAGVAGLGGYQQTPINWSQGRDQSHNNIPPTVSTRFWRRVG